MELGGSLPAGWTVGEAHATKPFRQTSAFDAERNQEQVTVARRRGETPEGPTADRTGTLEDVHSVSVSGASQDKQGQQGLR
jgi:hypothetical protein